MQFSDSEAGMTANGGVELRHLAAMQSGAFGDLPAGVAGRHGWTDGQIMLPLCQLDILGWKCADDLDRMKADEALCLLLSRHEARMPGVSRRSLHRSLGRGHRNGQHRMLHAPRSLLDRPHGNEDEDAAQSRAKGEAQVAIPSTTLAPLVEAKRQLAGATSVLIVTSCEGKRKYGY